MPRNGAGVYSLPSGINPVVTQTLITSNWANTTMTDIANALTGSVARDGQTTMTGNLNMGGFQVLGLGAPTQGNSAVSLSYVQSGAQFRLTDVSGTANQITATLPGGSTGFILGQLVELIPAANNGGAVTMNVNGVGYAPVVSGVGNPLSKNSLLAGTIYLLAWDGANWRILTSPNASAFAQAATSGWDRPVPGPTFPDITKVNANTVNVPAGAGRLVAPGARDLGGVTEVSWVAQNVVLTNVLNAWCTTLAIDSNGAVVQLIGPIQSQWYRQYIVLGVVAHIDGQIDGIVQQPAVFGDAGYTALDLGTLFHNTITAGGQVIPSANTLHMDVKAGRMWLQGGNSDNPNNTNFVDFPDQLDITFYPVTANNTVAVATQAAPVTQYNPGGVGGLAPIPVPTTQAVIHRLYLMAGQYVWCFGQTLYPDLNTAIQSINNDNATFKPPGKLVGATLFAYICANAVCTNLNDGVGGRIVAANAVSATAGGGGGGGVSEAPIDGQAYARQNAAWWRTIFLDPNFNAMLGSNAKADGISLSLNAQAGTTRSEQFQSSGVNRFGLVVDSTAEAGANAGSNFQLKRYADNGAFLSTSLDINRATGQVTMADGWLLVGADNYAGAARLWLDAAAAQQKKVQFQTAGKARFEIGTDVDAEAGADAGSTFYLQSFTDAGVAKDRILSVNRANSWVTYGYNGKATDNWFISNAAAGRNRGIGFQTNGLFRWSLYANNAAESGANVGSDLVINSQTDAGATLAAPFQIQRSTGQVTIGDGTQSNALVYAASPTAWNSFVFVKGSPGGPTPNRWDIMVDTDANNAPMKILRSGDGVTWTAAVTIARGSGAVTLNTSGITNTLTVNDPSGPHISFVGGGGSYPNKWIRAQSSALGIINNAYTQVMLAVNDFGNATSLTCGGGVYPAGDNAFPLGSGTARWTVVWAVTGTINTCDVREKDIIGPNELGLALVKAVPVSRFKYKVGHHDIVPLVDDEGTAILDENGDFQSVKTPVPGTRTHISGMAQDVVTQLKAAGLDPSDSAIWALDDPNDPDSRQGLRTEQLLWVLWTAVQELSKQVEALQAK